MYAITLKDPVVSCIRYRGGDKCAFGCQEFGVPNFDMYQTKYQSTSVPAGEFSVLLVEVIKLQDGPRTSPPGIVSLLVML